MQARAERRAPSGRRHRRDDPRPARWAAHSEAPVLRHDGCHHGQIDAVADTDEIGGQIALKVSAAAAAAIRAMLDDSVGHLAHHPAMALMTQLGPAGLGLLAPLLAIRGRRLGGGVRVDLLPGSGGVGSDYQAASRMVSASMLARASAGVR